jgi:orotate phosphoribosyltransferase
MHLIPTQDEVVAVLRETGALREGHFEYSSGLHSNEYLQVPMALRYYQYQRMLSVGLSRLLRANSEIRAVAVRARQVYWAEREHDNEPLRFRQYLQPKPGEQVVLVDDILRTGSKLQELKRLLESFGASVAGLAVIVYQPTPRTVQFGSLPLYYLARLEASYYADAAHCDLCARGAPLEKVLV